MPQTILSQGAAGSTIAGVDDAYIIIQPPAAGSIPNALTNLGGAVGTASWGALNTAQVIGSGTDVATFFGAPTLATYDLCTDLTNLLKSGANNLRGVRISDGTDVAAVLKVVDNTGFATDTLTVAGTFASGVTISTTLTPVSGPAVTVTYVTQTSDVNLAGIAASFATAINASAAVAGPNAFLQACTVAGAVITLKALVAGTSQNTVGVTATGTGVTVTAATATLTGGIAAGVIATLTGRFTGSLANAATYSMSLGSKYTSTSPTYRLTISFPNSASEVYDNIVAYATAGAGFSGATFAANLVNAVNGTPALSQLRPASAFFIATVGSSTVAPNTTSLFGPTTLGVDGSAFALGYQYASYAQLGNSVSVPPTGMYALSGQINGGGFVLCGNTDLAGTSAAAIAFAQANNAFWVGSHATGTSSAAAIALMQSLGLAAFSAIIFKDFAEFTDTVNNVTARRVPMSAFALGRILTTSPETSPANQRIALITGTERTGAITNSPYSPAELYSLEQAGVNVVTTPCPGGAYFGIRHNKNSLGQASPQGNIAYTRMTQFIAQSLNTSLLGAFVGLAQSKQSKDPVRSKLRALLTNFFQPLVSGNVIDSFQVLCTLQNNSAANIAAGILRADVTVVYLSVIDKLIISVTGGQTVTITQAPGTTVASS